MATCQNGLPVLTSAQCVVYTIGDSTRVRLAPGSIGSILAHFGTWFDKNVRDIDAGILDDWGWADRKVRGSETDVSNHAGGYALDINATKWALGAKASIYLTPDEIARVHAQLAVYGGKLRWGADYVGRTDPMHVEWIGTQAEADALWAALTAAPIPAPAPVPVGHRTLRKGDKGDDVKMLQRTLNVNYPLYSKLVVDGDFGNATDKVVREFQRRAGLTVDGIVGPKTWARLGL